MGEAGPQPAVFIDAARGAPSLGTDDRRTVVGPENQLKPVFKANKADPGRKGSRKTRGTTIG
jgi:hypothetical protein